MSVSSTDTVPSAFFERLHTAPASYLLLDYDGTLAPFQTERLFAYPYPEVVPLLQRILDTGASRIVIITGRPIAELQPLIRPLRDIEIWGSHGIEHLSVEGAYSQSNIPAETAGLLAEAADCLGAAGLADRTESKPGGVAIHWRGLAAHQIKDVYDCAHECLRPFLHHPGLKLLAFDGGVELRVAHPHKGDAVASLLSGVDAGIPVAYLGDDHTDEAAFRVLNPRGLTVLVRREYRKTNAQVWLHPPQELIGFLQQWLKQLT